jgi:diacylglycerol kinase family enzyme
VERVRAAFATHRISAEILLLPGEELLAAAKRARARAEAGEIDAVVVGGGDGTISTVAGVLAGTGIPLGLLPLGTLNHFAKDLGLPLDLDGAVAAIAAGVPRPIDVAEVNDKVFVNNSSIGLYPYMVLDRDRRRRLHGLAKWTAMALAAFRALRYLPVRRLSIRAEGWSEPCRTPCLFIGNNEYSLAMPELGRRASLQDGALCLYVARAQGRLHLLWLALRAALGFFEEMRDLRNLTVASVEIDARTSRLLVARDGEVEFLRPPLRYRARPGALQVLLPAGSRDLGV